MVTSPTHPPGAPHAPRRSEPRDRLLRTASALFYAEGIRSVGVDRVVSAASVTRSTFYRHFPGKEDLVAAYLQATDQLVREHLEGVRAAGSPADRLRAIVAAMGAEVCRPGFRGCPFINAAAEYPDPASAPHRAVVTHRAWLAGHIRDAFVDLGAPDPDAAARHLVMLRDGAMVEGYLADPQRARATLTAGLDALLAVHAIG
jgi:AcrR family transcriptional regulator